VNLSGAQMEALWAEMGAGFTIEGLTMFLRFRLEKELEDFAPNGSKKERIFSILDHADRTDWLCRLLAALAESGPNRSLKELAARLQADVFGGENGVDGRPQNPLQACLVSRRPFVDRRPFRTAMGELCDENARVAVIKGPSGGGNSHSWYFVKYLAKKTGKARASLVDLKRWKGADAPSPDELMESIASQLGLTLDGWPRDDLAQGTRRSIKLVDWLVRRSADLPERCWLVLDHLDRFDLPDDTIELAEQLAVEVETGNIENLSLVLIGFDRNLRDDLDPYLLRDAPAGFNELQVSEHFAELAAEAGHAISKTKLAEVVAETFAGLEPNLQAGPDELPFTKEQMQVIGARLAHLSARVLRGEDLQ